MNNFVKSILFIFLTAAVCMAQEAPRQKIGVALSGGGARGFAHIGVLQWFEEHRIPVDVIAGTSMGGLIGGLYATGRTPQQMKEIAMNIDWVELLRPVPPYVDLSFRRKEDRRDFANYLELGLRGGLKLPPGLNSGHAIGLLFDRLMLPYGQMNSFDNLPIPFRCLATDMVAAQQIVLSKGSLPLALQATMSIPGVFAPIEMDGHILASDGGLLNNIPTNAVEDMAADVIIAVDIGTPLGKKEALQSLTGVLNQTISVMMEENSRKSVDPALHPNLKLVLRPELKEYTTFAFTDAEQIIKLGYEDAEAHKSELMQYSLSPEQWAEYLKQKQSRIRSEAAVPQSITVSGASPGEEKLIRKKLAPMISQPVSPEKMQDQLNKIWGLGRYASLTYWLQDQDQKPTLFVLAREKTYAPPILNLGLELNNTQTDVFDFNLRARATFFDFLRHGSELRTDLSLGSNLLLGAEYYKKLGTSNFFLAPNAHARKTKTGLFSEGSQIAQYETKREDIGIDTGYEFGSTSELRLGYSIGHAKASLQIGEPVLPDVSGKRDAMQMQWIFDDTNSPVVPTTGVRATTQARWIFDTPAPAGYDFDTNLPQFNTRLASFFPAGQKNTIVLIGEGDTSFGYDPPPADQFTLGGLFRVSGLGRDELRANHVLYGSVGYLRKLGQLPPLIGEKISAGIWLETGSAFNKWNDKKFTESVSAGIIVETLLGPIFTGGSWAEGGRGNFYFAIGRFF